MKTLETNLIKKIPVGILGATGLVGQKFIQLLDNHPFFYISVIAASKNSSTKMYKDAISFWDSEENIPNNIKQKILVECNVENFSHCKLVFSALDSNVAYEIENNFVNAGITVFSNSNAFRMNEKIPLVVPLVNYYHISKDILTLQKNPNNAFIITNANCSTTGLAVAIKPLFDIYGIKKIIVHTMQAISGSGYPGVSSIKIIDNIIPFISNEEEKIETELLKILSVFTQDNNQKISWNTPNILISSSCNRVNVINGHTLNISVEFASDYKPQLEEIKKVFENYNIQNIPSSSYSVSNCPSIPTQPIVFFDEIDRPQPRLDRFKENGMAISIGRLRTCPILDIKFTCVVHNTILGAAGSSILNAEIAVNNNLIN
jgi:aspartate-semialdehyde dehydrogenase